jgi:hypothetical protein
LRLPICVLLRNLLRRNRQRYRYSGKFISNLNSIFSTLGQKINCFRLIESSDIYRIKHIDTFAFLTYGYW